MTKETKLNLEMGRPLVLKSIKRYVENVASPDTERKIALFLRTSKRRQRVVVKLLRKDPLTQDNHAILIKNSSLNFSSMNTNFNVMQDDTWSWWINSGASRHICNSTKWFKILHKMVDGEHLFLGNNASIMVQGKGLGQIELLFTSGISWF